MTEKYFATILKKQPVGENDFIYVFDSIIAGDIDEKTFLLTTASGEKYKRIDDFSNFDENTLYYANTIEVDKIVETFENKYSFPAAINEYEKRCKDLLYFGVRISNKDFILMPIDKRPYLSAMEHIQQAEELYETTKDIPEEYKKKEEDEDIYVESLKELVSLIIEDRFSPDELLDIKYRLLEQQSALESAIASVNLQCEALEDELDEILGYSKKEADVPSPKPLSQKTESNIKLIDVNDIFSKVTQVLIAQDKPARRMIVELSRLDKMRKKDYGILLTGQSGAGKTLMMQLIGKHLNRPVLHIDSTQLTAAGYVGQSIEEKLWELYESCGHDLKKAERAIVFFDEIDKQGGTPNKGGATGQAVLNMLLKFLDGTKYTASKNLQRQTDQTTVVMDTSNMIIVGGGAFLDVYERKTKPQCGFSVSTPENNSDNYEPTMTDFIDKAMMTKEFMGRVPVIIHLNNLNIDSLRRILLESHDSALKLQEEVFAKEGVKLTTKDGYIIAIASRALDEKIGARGLNKLITDSTWVAYDEVISNPGIYEEVILNEETVENENNYQLVKKVENKKSS